MVFKNAQLEILLTKVVANFQLMEERFHKIQNNNLNNNSNCVLHIEVLEYLVLVIELFLTTDDG